MPDTTLEKARRCFKCGEPGELTQTLPGPKGRYKVQVYTCKNERCKIYDQTIRTVQVNRDGSIPVRPKGAKEFPNPDRMNQLGASYLEYLQHEVDSGETRGPA